MLASNHLAHHLSRESLLGCGFMIMQIIASRPECIQIATVYNLMPNLTIAKIHHPLLSYFQGKYIRVDGDGSFLCDSDEKTNETAIIISAQADGRWALKSEKYGWYLGSKSAEDLKVCVAV